MLGKNPKDAVIVHVDGKGLKSLFSHGIRRFKDRCDTSEPRPYLCSVYFCVTWCRGINEMGAMMIFLANKVWKPQVNHIEPGS